MFTHDGFDPTSSYESRFTTLAACDAELERLRLADLDTLVMKEPAARAAVGVMRGTVSQRRAALVAAGITQ